MISSNVVCATSKASDTPTLTQSLIRAFASRLFILCYSLNIIWSFKQETAQAGLSLHLSKCHIFGNHMSRLILFTQFNHAPVFFSRYNFWLFPCQRLFCCLLITFADSLKPDQDQQNVPPDLDLNSLRRLKVFCEKFYFEKKVNRGQQKHEKLPRKQWIKMQQKKLAACYIFKFCIFRKRISLDILYEWSVARKFTWIIKA